MAFSKSHAIVQKELSRDALFLYMNHFARSAGRKGVVIWGGTRWPSFGYKQNKNINYWFRDGEWDEEKFEPEDPRNILVEPEFVFEQFQKIYGKDLV